MNLFRRSPHSESGASAVEYGLLVALIAAVIILAVFAIGQVVKKSFGDTCTSFKAKQTGSAASGNCGS